MKVVVEEMVVDGEQELRLVAEICWGKEARPPEQMAVGKCNRGSS